jgi:hypothetical protein
MGKANGTSRAMDRRKANLEKAKQLARAKAASKVVSNRFDLKEGEVALHFDAAGMVRVFSEPPKSTEVDLKGACLASYVMWALSQGDIFEKYCADVETQTAEETDEPEEPEADELPQSQGDDSGDPE